MCAFFFFFFLSCCSDRRKSFVPSVPTAYATFVSPPDEAAAWPRTQVFGAGYGCRFSRCRCLVLDMAAAWPAWRCRMANYATGCPWHSSCKSSRTLTYTATYDARSLHQCRALGEQQSSRRKTKVFFLLSFYDLSHHRTCRSAYGGSLHSVQLNVVVH